MSRLTSILSCVKVTLWSFGDPEPARPHENSSRPIASANQMSGWLSCPGNQATANLRALLSEAGSRDWSVLFLVQWPLLRNFSDQLNRGRVETCLLLFFGQILLRVLTAATRELVASLMPFLGQPRKN